MATEIESKIENENVVNFDEVIEATGTGVFQYKVVSVGGFSLLCSYITVSGISYVLPAAQCDLDMNSLDKGNLISAGFLGLMFSCHMWGFLSDRLGRRYILIRCLFFDGLLYIITCFVPHYSAILVLRFFNGVASCGGTVSLYAYVGEFHSNKNRTTALMFTSLIASAAYVALPAIAWAILTNKWSFILYTGLLFKPWRLYYGLMGLPSLTCCLLLNFLPESPKFLLAKGDKLKALEVLQRIYKENNKKEHIFIKNVEINEEEKLVKIEKNSNKVLAFFNLMWKQTIPLFKSPHRLNLFLVCFTQYLLFLSNGGLYLWLPETMNRMAVFKNDNGNQSATYCEIVQYKNLREITIFNKTNYKSDSIKMINNTDYGDSFNKTEAEYGNGEETCSDNIDPSVFLYVGILGITQCIVIFFAVTLTCFEKKYVIGIFSLLATFTSAGLLVVNSIHLVPVVANIIIVLSGASIPTLNSIAVDLFPTNLRAMAGCLTLLCCRFGTISTNILAGSFIDSHCTYLVWIFIFSFAVCLVLILLIPKKGQQNIKTKNNRNKENNCP